MIFQNIEKNVTWCTVLKKENAVLMAPWKTKNWVPIVFADKKTKIRRSNLFADENVFFRKSSVKTCVKTRE